MIVQLVAPVPGGVHDHADCLAACWSGSGLHNGMLELSRAASASHPLSARLAPGSTLLVHFSGYGFHPRGLCSWLPDAIGRLRQAHGRWVRVVTFFHELYAQGPPWRSAFWLAAAQWHIAARMCALSDAVITNSQRHAAWLRARGARAVTLAPIFSTVGEPPCIEPALGREPRLLVFGSAGTRRRALERLPRWAPMLRESGIADIVEVGSGEATPMPRMPIAHRFMGRLDGPELDAVLARSAFGLIDYPSVHLAKSSVYAAYAANGCVVLDTARPGPQADGLLDGMHFVSLSRGRIPIAAAARQAMAAANRLWYDGHALASQAALIAGVCRAEP